ISSAFNYQLLSNSVLCFFSVINFQIQNKIQYSIDSIYHSILFEPTNKKSLQLATSLWKFSKAQKISVPVQPNSQFPVPVLRISVSSSYRFKMDPIQFQALLDHVKRGYEEMTSNLISQLRNNQTPVQDTPTVKPSIESSVPEVAQSTVPIEPALSGEPIESALPEEEPTLFVPIESTISSAPVESRTLPIKLSLLIE
ncbi:hypothetical protein WDU94_005690, partial [Cyamophila willieti]